MKREWHQGIEEKRAFKRVERQGVRQQQNRVFKREARGETAEEQGLSRIVIEEG